MGGGMYNAVIGDGQEMERAFVMARVLGLKRRDFGRLRDAWAEITDEGELQLAFYTRNGGGNRADYAEVTAALQASPFYLSDADDTFDSTYATYRFSWPEEPTEGLNEYIVSEGTTPYTAAEYAVLKETITDIAGPVRDMDAVWQQAIAALETSGPSEQQIAKLAENVQIMHINPKENPDG